MLNHYSFLRRCLQRNEDKSRQNKVHTLCKTNVCYKCYVVQPPPKMLLICSMIFSKIMKKKIKNNNWKCESKVARSDTNQGKKNQARFG